MKKNKNNRKSNFKPNTLLEKYSIIDILIFFKAHLGTFIFAAIVLGAFWQVGHLAGISFNYIRFLSLTQIIQDGILILLSCIIAVLGALAIYLAINTFYTGMFKLKFIRKLNYTIYKIRMSFLSAFLLLFLMISPAVILWKYLTLKSKLNYPEENYLEYRYFAIAGASIFVLLLIMNYITFQANKSFKNHLINASMFPYIFVVPYFLICSLGIMGQKFSFPNNMENLDYLKRELKAENPEAKIEFLYMNDKYLFAKIYVKKIRTFRADTVNKIRVLRFEDLFEKIEPKIAQKSKSLIILKPENTVEN